MNMKKTLPILALAMITMFAVTAVRAQSAETTTPPKAMPKMGQMMSPENQAARMELWQAHQKKVGPIRDQLWAKKMEYEFLVSRPEAKLADVKPIIEEMVKLKGQLRTERESFAAEARAKGFGPMGMHPMGFDRDGRGHGFDRGDCMKMMGRGKHKDGRGHGGPGMGRPQADDGSAAHMDMDM